MLLHGMAGNAVSTADTSVLKCDGSFLERSPAAQPGSALQSLLFLAAGGERCRRAAQAPQHSCFSWRWERTLLESVRAAAAWRWTILGGQKC